MPTQTLEIRRLSIVSSKPFDDVLGTLTANIGRPDMNALRSALERTKTLAELVELVQGALGPSQLMEFVRFDLGRILADHHAFFEREHGMKRLARLPVAVLVLVFAVACEPVRAAEGSEGEAVPIFGIKLPAGYRDWRLVSVAREEWLKDIRAILGNDRALEAYRAGKLPFPDGTIIARLAWDHQPSEENETAFLRVMKAPSGERFGSFVAGHPKNGVQFMLKDSKKYAATGGWGFAQFNDGKPADEKVHQACFPCHEGARDRDFVFTRYAR